MIGANGLRRNSDIQLKFAIERCDIHVDLATQSKVISDMSEQSQEEHILFNRRNTSESSPDSERVMDGSPLSNSGPELENPCSERIRRKDVDTKVEVVAESKISDTEHLDSTCKIKQFIHSPAKDLPDIIHSVIDEESETRDIINSSDVDAQNATILVPNGMQYKICDDIDVRERMDIESPGSSNTSGYAVAALKQGSTRELLHEEDEDTKSEFPDDPDEPPVGDVQRTGETKRNTAIAKKNKKKKVKRNVDEEVFKLNQLVWERRKRKKEAKNVKREVILDEREQIQEKTDIPNNITLYSGLDCAKIQQIRVPFTNFEGLALPTDNTSSETEDISTESFKVFHPTDSIKTCHEISSPSSDPSERKLEKMKLKISKKGHLGRQVSIVYSASDTIGETKETPENLPSTDVLPDVLNSCTNVDTFEASSHPTDLEKKPRKRKLKDKEPNNSSATTKTKKPKKEIKRVERKREQAKLLREAKLAKREERQRRERVKERQKELDERYQTSKDNDEGLDKAEDGCDDIPEGEDSSEVIETPSIPVLKRYVLEEDSDLDVVVEIDPVLLAKLKPHQIEAVRFMYDCCIESIQQRHQSEGGGCILAHCMGLGKTLSVITFIYSLMSNNDWTCTRSCLIVCPLNTVKNWVNEFDKWLFDLTYKIDVYEISNVKDNKTRGEVLNKWRNEGGVMILGYEMYRSLVLEGRGKVRVQKETYADILANPGPDLVICDEGHILKNSKSLLYKAMNRIKTRRRVILTGTPLQNNLKEYYHMVNYVKPLLLSTMKNFQLRFITPITEGQCKDSSTSQMNKMKNRVHVLHKILGGCVQRKDYSALTKFLLPKHEYVISVRLGPKQCTLYEKYLRQTGVDGVHKVHGRDARLFKDYQALMKIWTHPWLLTQESNKKEAKKNKSNTQLTSNFANVGSLEQSPYTDTETNSILCLPDINSNKDEIEMDISSEGPTDNNIHMSNDIAIPSEVREDSHLSPKDGEISDKGYSTPTSPNNSDMPKLTREDDTAYNEENLSAVGDGTQMCFEKIDTLGGENINCSPSNDKPSATEESSPMSVDYTDPLSVRESVSPASPELKHILSDTGERTHMTIDKAATSSTMPEFSIVVSDDEDNLLETKDKDQLVLCNADMSSASEETSRLERGSWWKEHVCDADGSDMTLGGKIMLLFEILDMCRSCGDKLLVFSQSIPSLNLIERFLKIKHDSVTNQKGNEKSRHTWVKDKHYFRIDGTTNAQKRKDLQKSFNDLKNKSACLFLISTKAGSLGTNLVAANRVIIFDASWNPSHDIQSIFRAYRFGQVKPVYVYRFLAQGTMEEKIYERQVTKQSLSQRVIDEHQIERHFTQADLQALYEFKPDRLDDIDRQDRPLPVLPKDELLASLMTNQRDLIVTFHEHDSLLENIEEQELTEDEKKVAWEEYERKALHIFTPMEPDQSPGYDEYNDRPMEPVQSPGYDDDSYLDNLHPSAGLIQLSGIGETTGQVDMDQWLQQPEHSDLLNSIEDLIQEKCPEVLMVDDEYTNENKSIPMDYSQTNVFPSTSVVYEDNPHGVVDVGRSCEAGMQLPIRINAFVSISGDKSTVNMEESQRQTATSVDNFSTSAHPAYSQEVQSSPLVLPEMPMNQSNSTHFIPIFSNNNQRDLNTPDLEIREYQGPDNKSIRGTPTTDTDVNQRHHGSSPSGVYMKPKQKMMERLLLDYQQNSPSSLSDVITFERESPTPAQEQLVPLNLSIRDSSISATTSKNEVDHTIQKTSERINDYLDIFKKRGLNPSDTSSTAPRPNETVQTKLTYSHSEKADTDKSLHYNHIIPLSPTASISDETILTKPEELDEISTDSASSASSPGEPELVIDMSVDTNEHSNSDLEQRIPLTVLQTIDTRQLSESPDPISPPRPYSPLKSGGYEDISDTDSD